MRGRVHAKRTLKGLVADLRIYIGVSDLGRVGFAMHYWLHLSNSSMLDCIRFERSFSPFETKSETLVYTFHLKPRALFKLNIKKSTAIIC